MLKSVRSNKTENVIHKFDGLSCDVLAIYCVDHNKMQYFTCLELDGRSTINIDPNNFKEGFIE